jgi:hypothetical protein
LPKSISAVADSQCIAISRFGRVFRPLRYHPPSVRAFDAPSARPDTRYAVFTGMSARPITPFCLALRRLEAEKNGR